MLSKLIRPMLVAVLFLSVGVRTSSALDLDTSPEYTAKEYEVDLRGGLAYLGEGSIVGFSGPKFVETETKGDSSSSSEPIPSFDLVLVKLNSNVTDGFVTDESTSTISKKSEQSEPSISILKTFSGNLAPAFARSLSDGSSVLLGTVGEKGKIFRLNSKSLELSEIVSRSGLRDLVAIDSQSAYVLYEDGSSGLEVALLRLEPSIDLVPLIKISSFDYYSLALVADGSLYVVNSRSPESESSKQNSAAKRFSGELLWKAINNQTLLSDADAEYSVDLPYLIEMTGPTPSYFMPYGQVDSSEIFSEKSAKLSKRSEDFVKEEVCKSDDCQDPDPSSSQCASEDGKPCDSFEEIDYVPWEWDEIYALDHKSLNHHFGLSLNHESVAIVQSKKDSSMDFSHFAMSSNQSFMLCGSQPNVAVAATDLSTNKSYLIELTATPIEVDALLACYSKELSLGDGAVASYSEKGSSAPVYSLWNSFLGMINVIELINGSDQDAQVTVSLYLPEGKLVTSTQVVIQQNAQKDMVLNDLVGFVDNSYGIVKVESNNSIDGRLVFYKAKEDFDNFDFAFVVPLLEPAFGQTSAGFNTFNPSADLNEANLVANWVSVANLSDHSEKFNVEKLDQGGSVLSKEQIELLPMGRVDLEGGHINPGPSKVGVIKISPEDSSSPYIAGIVRYALDEKGSFGFALPVVAESGTSMPLIANISAEDNSKNWLEIINTGSDVADVEVKCYGHSGNKVSEQTAKLSKFAQIHLDVSGGVGDFGTCQVDSSSGAPLLVESMQYYNDPKGDGSVETASASHASPVLSTNIEGSYNLYLDIDSSLRLSNPDTHDAVAEVSVFGPGSERGLKLREETITLPAKSSVSLDLNEGGGFGTNVNTYGLVQVSSDRAIHGQVLRKRKSEAGALDFVLSTELR